MSKFKLVTKVVNGHQVLNVEVAGFNVAHWTQERDGTFTFASYNRPGDLWYLSTTGVFAPASSGLLLRNVALADLEAETEQALEQVLSGGMRAEVCETGFGYEIVLDGESYCEWHGYSDDGWFSGYVDGSLDPEDQFRFDDETVAPEFFSISRESKAGSIMALYAGEVYDYAPLMVAAVSYFRKGSRFG